MTLNEIAYNIKNIVEGGIAGEDSNLSLSQIKHMIHYHRASLLTKYTDSGRYVSEECCSIITGSNEAPIFFGRLIGWPNLRAIKEVMLSQPTSGIPKIINVPVFNSSERDFALSTRFAPNESQLFAMYTGLGSVVIINSDGTNHYDANETITIKAVLDNPEAVTMISGYPIPADLIESLVETVLAKEFNIYLRVSSDNTNNSVDDKMAKMAAPQTKAAPSANARSKRARTR
jgi:hypothetical protein|tara:strand:- start:1790 stop:2482 length:693 start_codon:yes stop_codon:yes gene_type:complete